MTCEVSANRSCFLAEVPVSLLAGRPGDVGRLPWGIAGHHHADHWSSPRLLEVKPCGAQALSFFHKWYYSSHTVEGPEALAW